MYHYLVQVLDTVWQSANLCNPEVKRMCWLAQANVSLSISQ